MTIEERAKQKAWEFEPTDMLQYNVYIDAYVDGATDQREIDIEKAVQFLEREYSYNGSMAVINTELIEQFKQAMEE